MLKPYIETVSSHVNFVEMEIQENIYNLFVKTRYCILEHLESFSSIVNGLFTDEANRENMASFWLVKHPAASLELQTLEHFRKQDRSTQPLHLY